MTDSYTFFESFGKFNAKLYNDQAMSNKQRELIKLAAAVYTKCDKCILHHLHGSLNQGANLWEIMEAIKIGAADDPSSSSPNARYAFDKLQELIKADHFPKLPDPPV